MQHFGIIGKPLGHSQSKKYFEELFRERKIDADYTIHELEAIEEVVPLLDLLDGLNVTSPYKELIIPYLNGIDETAQAVGAVNVVYRHWGYNTDWIGARAALQPHLRKEDKQAFVLGTGGAARAVRYALSQLGLKVTTVSRQPGKSDLTYADLTPELITTHSIIANCTPVGMRPLDEEAPDIPYDCLSEKHLLFDCIYNPAETVFLQKGKQHGARTLNGQDMFLAQAEAAAKIFEIK